MHVFSRAKEESGEKSLKKWAEYIADYLSEELKYPLSVKTLERYYNGETQPNNEKRNQLARFLGYRDYKHYVSGEAENMVSEKQFCTRSHKRRAGIPIVVGGIFLVILAAGFLGYSSGSEACMIWVEDHYEAVKCEGREGETELVRTRLEGFRQIEVGKSTQFFRYGKPKVWYDKAQNKLYFFSAPGINPETGKTLKPITNYMLEKYVFRN